ncbi:MAG: DUF1704 domain-containing protein, partial [Pirellulales bacterium]|nr:DUF1704 domain-containing protein [Pirellulales bacterium]
MTEPDVNADFDRVIAAVHDRLSRNLRLRRTLPGDGRLRLDRQLPFLCVYRTPPQGGDNGTRDLVTTEAAYLFASGEPEYAAGIGRVCQTISEIIQEHFGALLLIEIWADDELKLGEAPRPLSRPGFRIFAPQCDSLGTTLPALEAGLQAVRLHGVAAEVETTTAVEIAPPGQPPLAPSCRDRYVSLGIAVRPVYRSAQSGVLFPIVLQSLRRQLAVAIRKAVFAFTGRHEVERTPRMAHFEALGPSAIARAGREVDQELAEISQSFEFLLYSTPVNSDVAWQEFAASGHRRLPVLYYRPLPYDPALIKRQLYSVPVEHVEDPTLAHLFLHKQDELGLQLDALKRIGTPGFFYDSLHLHGKPDDELVQLADDILVRSVDGDDES